MSVPSKIRVGMVLYGQILSDIRVINEISYLTHNNCDIFVLVPYSGFDKRINFFKRATIIQLTIKSKLGNLLLGTANVLPFFKFYWSRKIKSFIDEFKIDILHVHDLYMGEPPTMVPQITSGKVPLIIDLHENYPAAVMEYLWASKFPKNLVAQVHKWKEKEGNILKSASGLVVLSNFYKRQLIDTYDFLDPNSIIEYPNVPDAETMLDYAIKKSCIKKQSFCLLYFGVVARRRGIQTAIQALEILNKTKKICELLVIGNIDNYDRNYFQGLFQGKDVQHIPWIPISELRTYVEISDVCISPLVKNDQHDSGVANKIFQYMLYGKPILGSNCVAQAEVIQTHNCGLIHESENSNDFADKVMWFIQHEQQAKEMGEKGKDAIINHLNLEKMGSGIIDLYHKLLGY